MAGTRVPTKSSVKSARDAIHAGEHGRLQLGRLVSEWTNSDVDLDEVSNRLRDQGTDLPSKSRLSVFKGVYETWVNGMGADPNCDYYSPDLIDEHGTQIPMRLTGVAIDKLYFLRNEVVNSGSLADTLALAYNHTDAELRARNKYLKEQGYMGRDDERDAAQEQAQIRQLRLNKDSYDAFMNIVDRLRVVQNDPNISKAQAFDFVVAQFDADSLSDASLSFLWRQAHGEVTQEELEQVEEMELEVAD